MQVDDADLQDEPLQIRIMDHDTYSANDAIGKVNLSLNPLLLPSLDASIQPKSGKGSVMSGWYTHTFVINDLFNSVLMNCYCKE